MGSCRNPDKETCSRLNHLKSGHYPDKFYPVLEQNCLISVPYPRLNCLKIIPFTVAHTHVAYSRYGSTPPLTADQG